MASATSKKPVNRKLFYVALVALLLIGLLAMVVLSVRDPQAAREKKQEEARQAAIASQSTGTDEQAKETLNELDRNIQRERDRAQQAQGQAQDPTRSGFEAMVGGGQAPPAQGTEGMPPFDADLARKLAAFDQAQQAVAPRHGARSGDAGSQPPSAPGVGGGAGGGGWGSAGGAQKKEYFENYQKAGGGSAESSGGGDLFGGGGALTDTQDSDEVFETSKAKRPPSELIVNPGVPIPVVIGNAIDTRNGGDVTGTVMRTIFDSRTHSIPLIPQGSRVTLTFDTTVEPGIDRIPGKFKSLILLDGSIIDLQSANAAALDGSFGIPGKYKSNFARAIGPAFVVAAMGQYIEREFPEQTMTTREGTTYQTPSVMQQVAPKLSEQVSQRYQSAKPYFKVKPGTEIRLVVSEPLQFARAAEGMAR